MNTITDADRAEMFAYLDQRREDGDVNMLQAGMELRDAFDLTRHQARDVFLAWTRQVSR